MPSPYVQDLFAEMAEDKRFDLYVLYLEQEAPDTYWGEQAMPPYARVLPGRWFGFSGARVHVNPAIYTALQSDRWDLVVIVGYVGVTNQMAMWYLTKRRRPWVFWGEIPGFKSRGPIGQALRYVAQRPLRNALGIAAVGSRAVAEYSMLFGQHSCVIRNIPYHCRLEAFEQAAKARTRCTETRFLYCGQLVHRKGVDLLCQAFSRLILGGADATLALVGEGPLRSALTNSLPAAVAERVRFLGFQPVERLPATFAAADVFVLPSRHDGWGVVVNQALAAGMPIIASRNVGAAHDLVLPEENGFRIEPNSADAIYSAMCHLSDCPQDAARFSARSCELAERISLSRGVDEWYDFFVAALQNPTVCATQPP